MSIKLSDSIRVGQQKPLEDKYFNELVPYTSTTQVNNLVSKAVRHIGLTVNIDGEEYWYKDGIEDENLIFKSSQKTIEVTRYELYDLIANDDLEPNSLYKITGVESWCFSKHLIKAIYLKAITNNTLETNGFGEFYNVNYGFTSVWAGNLLEAGLIDSLEYAVDDLVIWGNLLWTNISGAVGTNLKNFGEDCGDISLPNYLSDSDWLPLTPQESGGYNLSIDIIKYDIENDYISYREDTSGNRYEQSFSNLVGNYPNYEIVGSDASYMYYVGGISLFHWGEPDTVYGNTIKDSLVLNCNNSSQLFLTSSFYNNNFENSLFYENLIISSSIRNNKFLDSHFLYNHLKGSSVESNEYNKSYFTSNILDSVVFGNNTLLKQSNFENNVFRYISVGFNTLNSSYIVNNNLKNPNQSSNVRLYKNTLHNSSIQSNMYYIDIAFNILNGGSLIANNIDNEITVYNRISTITKNNLDNGSTINSNNFVEEGKGISGYSKGINDNILNNTCNINSNTIKNSSRIFGHKLEYSSTINRNTLDTDSNIYNNQLIQNGKIDNNILTGHGRIYGNQLDRKSEITNCKLRISPTTSYATTMKDNKLFSGKIQNIDFGDIVNPVGTNPNDPAFGGNDLSECIIENNSIIKDLTFPNVNNLSLQFIKMNGFSEFKNITINDSIKSVEFINSVFDETSDYSKIIEGTGYNGQGFTKYYLDNILLQDRFDEKQDVLTEDNVGSFMDLELPTKLTPTSGDTVLARDILTNKAVEIPITSLGGGGNIDTSNLVPYTGANKDVNIASNYFKTSKGFDFTKDLDNYFRTFHNGNYNILEFYSLDTSEDNFGKVRFEINPEGGFVFQKYSDSGNNFFQILTDSTYSTKKFVTEEGYQIVNGTATQSLTADGGVFDLSTKADLEGGKVPKAQSQPSTMVMNNSTYVITFTDATGAVQTIDLPLESLFKDANYNSLTKSLIVTLQDGTTRTIPLTDLVDLPEIVLATTNPAVTPTTGQKVYFNTSLGKVWFNVSGVWVFGGNLISDSEKTNLTTAYNHSQATGNPHNTKVEELTDLGSETTSIADTDIILKKESGGLWKKITFANFKNWFTTELAKKINIGLDTVFNFKNISAMTLNEFRSITPNIETIYFTEEQNGTGWQKVRYNGLGITIPATTETLVSLTNENFIELDSDSTFNLIDVANTKINGIFEKDFVIIKFNAGVVTPATANQWFKVILKVNNVQTAVSPVFYLTETSGTVEQIAHNFALNVPTEMVANGATLHLKTSAAMTFNNPAISVARVHKSTNANL